MKILSLKLTSITLLSIALMSSFLISLCSDDDETVVYQKTIFDVAGSDANITLFEAAILH